MSETKDKISGFQADAPGSEPEERAKRLRDAIRRGGGNKTVSERSGVSLTTLQNYLNGQPMKLDPALALAQACGVTLEWLATGKEAPSAPVPAPPAPAAPPKLFSIVDMDMLSAAIVGAQAMWAAKGALAEGRPFAQIVCLLYDEGKHRLANMPESVREADTDGVTTN